MYLTMVDFKKKQVYPHGMFQCFDTVDHGIFFLKAMLEKFDDLF